MPEVKDKKTIAQQKKLDEQKRREAEFQRRKKAADKLFKSMTVGEKKVKSNEGIGTKKKDKDFNKKLAKHQATEKHIKHSAGLVHFNNSHVKKMAKKALKASKAAQKTKPTGSANFFTKAKSNGGHHIDPKIRKILKPAKQPKAKAQNASFFTKTKPHGSHHIDPKAAKLYAPKKQKKTKAQAAKFFTANKLGHHVGSGGKTGLLSKIKNKVKGDKRR